MKTTNIIMMTGFMALSFAFMLPARGAEKEAEKATLDTVSIEREIGKAGEAKGDLYKLSLPRTDLKVTVDGVSVKPGFALGSWIAFKAVTHGAVAHGDLVLTEQEVAPVVQILEARGIQVTALHNHLIGESPRVMFLHFWGQGEAAGLAQQLKQALSKTKTPISEAKKVATPNEPADFDVEKIQTMLGYTGTVKHGVLHVSVPRSEAVTENGVELPPGMGTATAINIQAAGVNKVASTGDFVMTEQEVNRVAQALTQHGIQIMALHNHLLHDSPNLFFMHFWANDTVEHVAQGLKAGLDAMQRG
jgi:biotin operon repressor